jgi:hypothetical protein
MRAPVPGGERAWGEAWARRVGEHQGRQHGEHRRDMIPTEATSGHAELVARIWAAGRRWKRDAALVGVARVVWPLLLSLSVLLALEGLVSLPPVVRLTLLTAAAVFLAFGCAAWVVAPLARRLDPVAIAAEIELAHPHLGERLESSAELWNKRGTGRHGYSVELIDALILKTVVDAAGLDFAAAITPGERSRVARATVAAAVVAAAVLGLLGERRGPAIGRLVHPLEAGSRPIVEIEVEPGDVTVVSGDDVEVTARVSGPFDGTPVLSFRFEGEAVTTRTMREEGTEPPSFRVGISDIRSAAEYSVQAGDAASESYSITVMERPYLTGLRLEYDYPSYSGLLSRTVDENNGDITALAGTRVAVTVSASKRLSSAALVLDGGSRVRMDRADDRTFGAVLTVRDDTSYSVHIEDRDGLTNPDPPEYSVVAIRDEYPLVSIVEPGEDVEAPRGMVLPVTISAIDDYGISELSLVYSLEAGSDPTVVPLSDIVRTPREIANEFEWDLSETGLLPGRALVYHAEVVDNDRVGGPKSSRSDSYVVRFPSMSELYSEVTGEQDDILDELDELLDEQRDLKETFEEIREEVRSEQSMEWHEQERVEDALEQQESAADDVARMADRLSELSETMSESDRVTLETLEKVDEITRLLDEVADEEMRELIEKIREAMERVSPEDVSAAMETMTLTQDDYLRRLEQTLNLLKRVKAEQQLADAARRAEDLAGREEQLAREAAESTGGPRCERLSSEQDDIRKDTEKLLEDMTKFSQDMAEVDPEAAREMASAGASAEARGTVEKMQRASKQLSESKPSEAASSCQSAADDLLALFQRLSSCQSGMACSLQSRDREATLRAIDELLGVSFEQEEVVDAVRGRRRIPRPELVELVAKEADLVEAMSDIAERMFQVSKESFVIDPAVYRAFGVVQAMMTKAATHMADGGSAAGQKEATVALGSVNSLIVQLLTSNQSSSGSSGSALQQLMQQLQQMSEQQSMLNEMTEELRRRTEETGMSESLDRQLAEMRARQEQLLEEARRLAREFGDRREILGRLDDTANEMARTLEEMERSGASREAVDRQKRILSRLLDAQRSLRRRDYTRERRSRAGDDYAADGPDELGLDVERVTRELREDLLRAMQRGYPVEYRELIRAYFEGLTTDASSDAGEGAP